ncbi:branched-chain amino acid ABC transporter permease [Rhodospirillum rubrum]|uniref:branched-chain amino acid ABC transporter permease n=1 Tax=Rhodospirillum rubrum TaxID=1085 RepID=UPI001908F4E5|nr:branched-chain amino acid ABC transporter permease [Rhodospirillum rubrum]MBK1665385.1 branched-chain amino acid ABC transporter permease [Rhodospirillum rubrum]MBK1677293.1 branched-chain amino acid ABC transporter permease [Rhodospirillum rubrum]
MDSAYLLNLAFNGAVIGLITALAALSITLVFGIARFPNAATGDVATAGAFAGLLGPLLGSGALPIILVGMATSAAVSLLFYVVLFRALAKRSPVASLIASIGMAFFLRAVLTYFIGHDQRVYPLPLVRAVPFGPLRVQAADIQVIVWAGAALAVTFALIHLTPIGKRMRAVADNPDLARSSGINANKVMVVMWVVAGLLAGLAGTLLGVKTVVSPEMGWDLLMPAFAATILGTIGNPLGAVLGGLLIGLAQELSTPLVGFTYKIGVGFLVLLLTLLIRPQGLFAKNSLVR